MRRLCLALLLPLVLAGCIARTAVGVATLPVRAGAKMVDWTTTSQDEADRNRGRAERKREEREAEAQRRADKACRKHPDACAPAPY